MTAQTALKPFTQKEAQEFGMKFHSVAYEATKGFDNRAHYVAGVKRGAAFIERGYNNFKGDFVPLVELVNRGSLTRLPSRLRLVTPKELSSSVKNCHLYHRKFASKEITVEVAEVVRSILVFAHANPNRLQLGFGVYTNAIHQTETMEIVVTTPEDVPVDQRVRMRLVICDKDVVGGSRNNGLLDLWKNIEDRNAKEAEVQLKTARVVKAPKPALPTSPFPF